ncbi:MAG: LytTR family transcriptional regulator [Flavobacteriaceae bacterium]|nr:LytTR family transcriptional regulator [Flavobacteriaceae bacterium]
MTRTDLFKIGYWLSGSIAIAILFLKTFDGFFEAWLIALFLLTAAIFVKYSYEMIRHLRGFRKWLRLILIALVSLYWSYIAIAIAYWYLLELKGGVIEELMINPIFIWMIIGFLVLLEFQIFRKTNKKVNETISIYSNRKKIVLQVDSIAYIESRSDFTIAVLLDGETYKNNTTISDWSKKLDHFIRIHRAFLVNPESMVIKGNEILVNSTWNLPMSRKYKAEVINKFQNKNQLINHS